MTLKIALDTSFVENYSVYRQLIDALPDGEFYYKGIVIPYNDRQDYRFRVTTGNVGSRINAYTFDADNVRTKIATIIAVEATTILRLHLKPGIHRVLVTHETNGNVISESSSIKVQISRYATIMAALSDILTQRQNDYMIEYQRINGRIGLARFEMLLENDILKRFNSENLTKLIGIRKILHSLVNQGSFLSVLNFVSAMAGNTAVITEPKDNPDIDMGSTYLKTDSEFFSMAQIHIWEREPHATRRNAFARVINNFSTATNDNDYNLHKATEFQVELSRRDI